MYSRRPFKTNPSSLAMQYNTQRRDFASATRSISGLTTQGQSETPRVTMPNDVSTEDEANVRIETPVLSVA
jgi:hypothetical protein